MSVFMARGKRKSALGINYVEWLESTGTQFFDTGFIPNSNTRVVMDCEVLTFETAVYCGVCTQTGGSTSNVQTYDLFIINGTSTRGSYFGSTVSANGVATGRHIVDRNRNVITVGEAITITNAVRSGASAYNLYLLARNIGGTSADWQIDMKLYSCQIYDNDVLIRDYWPCLDPDGVPCLYDKVNSEYVYNAGTGEFIPGPGAEVKPSINYVDYLESTGTQYINTEFKNNQDSRIVIDAQVTKKPGANSWLFGGKNSTTVGARNVFLLNGTTWNVDYNSDGTRKSFSGIGNLERVNIDFNKNVVTINGATHTFAAATFQCNYEHYLFAQNKVGEVSGFIPARVYSCQIYDNDVLVRDFRPCFDPEGVACMYEEVEQKYYYNAGTGDFIAGMAA